MSDPTAPDVFHGQHPAFDAAERLAPMPADRDAADHHDWIIFHAAFALAAYTAFDDAIRDLAGGVLAGEVQPGSRPDIGYLVLLASAATSAAVTVDAVHTGATDDLAGRLWDMSPGYGALNGEHADWLSGTLDSYGINPADIDPRYVAGDFRSPPAVARLIEASSLGTPDAVAMRNLTPPAVAEDIVDRSYRLCDLHGGYCDGSPNGTGCPGIRIEL